MCFLLKDTEPSGAWPIQNRDDAAHEVDGFDARSGGVASSVARWTELL
jgi:hypothetical protein